MAYGFDHSRYEENKRSVPEKYMGPLIKTIMTRCIHCTRCVRFSTEIGGVEQMGLLNRGENAEITSLEQAVNSELSGNVVDVCPVGALTSRPYAFHARPWELRKTQSVDVMDAVGSNIRVDVRGREVLRVLPRLHEGINEEWIHDKTRHAIDGLKKRRLDRPFVRRDGKLQPATWDEAFDAIIEGFKGLSGDELAAIAGDLCDVESMLALKDFMSGLGSANIDCRQDGAKIGNGPRGSYIFNTSIAGIEEADACLIVGSNPRWEAAMVNARIRKRFLKGRFQVGLIGPEVDLTYDYAHLGEDPSALAALAKGKGDFAKVLDQAERPMIVLGSGVLARDDGEALLALAREIAERYGMVSDDWNGFNVLQRAASRVGGLDIGFLPGEGGRDLDGILAGCAAGDVKAVWLLAADEIPADQLGNAFVVYQGHHGDTGAHRADVILPGAAYTEKNGTYVNTEGRVQLGRLTVFPPGQAREDWTILRALSERLGERLPYDNLGQLRQRMIQANAVFGSLDQVSPGAWGVFGKAGTVNKEPFSLPIENFYMTDPISRSSETMAACSEAFVWKTGEATGTHG